ncbi:polymorphic toxin-type HINT domain-containing protein [Kribbella qitaiheensis]|uniref:golvesin C-terminal-like domain-containing protein n=1 Tax=Kribbella qitaiheensis TaxID=1544730 RepID=UPI0036075BF5
MHLYLQKIADPPDNKTSVNRAWSLTRPDRTQFFFDDQGFQSVIKDKNGNETRFTYEERKSANKPVKFLDYIADAAGRRTLSLDYFEKGQAYSYINDAGVKTAATNLTNPKIIDQVESITDISGRKVTFTYSDKGLMAEMVDGAGSTAAKTFKFVYDATNTNKNTKLVRITDPRGKSTNLSYFEATTDPKDKWKLEKLTDRLGKTTTFGYVPAAGSTVETTVTDATPRATKYVTDSFGRPVQTTNAKNETTKLSWDDDHNVTQLEEANGARSTWTYDPKTGFPLTIKDAEANANGTPGTVLSYNVGGNGFYGELIRKVSPEGRTWTFGYDPLGNLTSVTDPKGNATATADDYVTKYTYDPLGQLKTSTDANNNTTTYSLYHDTGYPTKITDALTKSTDFTYDVRGNVLTVTDAKIKTSTYTYDLFGRPLTSKVPKDQQANLYITTPAPLYDANDNVTQATAPNGAISTNAYDDADQLISSKAPKDLTTDPDRETKYEYDVVGNLLRQTEPKGSLTPDTTDFVTSYSYDPVYQLLSVTNAQNDKISYSYDEVGNVVTVVDPRKSKSTDPDDYTSKSTYDKAHRPKTATDALGKSTSTEYDRDGNVVSTTDADGNKTLVTLDERGKAIQVKAPHTKDASGNVVYRTTQVEYDQVGNQTKVITPRGVETTDDPDDFAQVTVYDALNRPKEKVSPYDKDDARYNTPDKTVMTYDEIGNVTKVSAPASEGQTVRNDTSYSYFDNGWVKSSTDPWEIAATYGYNDLGQQTARTLTSAGGSSSRTMAWNFFPDGKLKSRSDDGVPVGLDVSLVDNSDTGDVDVAGTWALSSTGTGFQGTNYRTHAAATGSTDKHTWKLNVPADGKYTVYVRYPAVTGASTAAPYSVSTGGAPVSKPVNQTTGAGTWVSLGQYTFAEATTGSVSLTPATTGTVVADAVKVVRDNTGETDAEKKDFTYTYDTNGNLLQITDTQPGAKVSDYLVSYNGLNQVAKVEEKKGTALLKTTTYTYNENGAPVTRSFDDAADKDDQFSSYTYDARDLVDEVKNGKSATDTAPKISGYTYTARGETDVETKANGNTVDSDYYLDGLVSAQIEKKSNGTLVSQHAMEYSPNGDRIKDTAKVQNADNHAAYLENVFAYTFDPLDRIAKVEKKDAAGATVLSTETYNHDAAGNVISQVVKNAATTFTYDRNRLLTATSDGTAASYTYDPFGRLSQVSSAGKVIERNTYDGYDRIIKHRKLQDDGTTKTTETSFDALDRTSSKVEGTKTTSFSYLGLSGEVLSEEVAGKVTASYQYSAWGSRLSQVKFKADGTSEDSYYGYNPHSDVETLTTEGGDTRSTYGYTAYGKNDDDRFTGVDKPEAQNPGKEPYNVYRFNAKRWDQSSESYDMGFRDYSPGLNRFLTRDAYSGALGDLNLSTDPWNGNRYAFAGGNPISRVEVDGHINESLSAGGGGDLSVVPVEDRIGNRDVAAEDKATYEKAFQAVKSRQVGQGPEYAIGCNDGYTHVGSSGGDHLCGASDVFFSKQFADDLCQQSGITCGPYSPGKIPGLELGSDGGGVRIGGGPETVPGGIGKRADGGACSFSGETLVEMADGSRKPISQVEEGDEVLATDPETGERGPRLVTRQWVHADTVLELETDSGTLTTTEDHPFWNATDGRFQRADQLDPGDQLLTADGQKVRVKGIRHASQRVAPAYNLTVDDIHTYYVLAGDAPVLVHNARCPHSNDIGAVAQQRAEDILGKQYPGNKMHSQFEIWTPHGVRRVDIAGENDRGGFDLYEIKGNGSNYPSRERKKDAWIEENLGWKTQVWRFDVNCQCYS